MNCSRKMRARSMRGGAVLFAASSLIFASAVAAVGFVEDAKLDRLIFGGGEECARYIVQRLPYCEETGSPSAPDYEVIYDAASADFEPQSKRIFVKGEPYPFAVSEMGGVQFVSPAEFFPFADPSAVSSEESGRVDVKAEKYTLECAAGRPYISVNGRCLFLESQIVVEEGRLMCPLCELTEAAGFDVAERDGDLFIDGEIEPVTSGDEFYDAEDLYWLSRIISCESMSEPLAGKIAVGNVVLNRVASSEFPQDVKGVVFDRRYGIVQFSPVAGGHIYKDPDPESVVAAKLCLEGVTVSDRILYFMNPRLADTTWISDTREAVLTIGNHTFYS